MNKKGHIDLTDIIFSLTMFIIIIIIPGISLFLGIKVAGIESILYNEKYGTHYTQSDFFWAGNTIKTMLQGGQQTTSNIKEKYVPICKLD